MVKSLAAIQLYGFSSVESPEAVAAFLEKYTGQGSVSDVKVFPPKDRKSRASAVVEFTHAESAEKIIPLADAQLLWYDEDSYLKARKWKPEHSIELLNLHFGCLVSEERFSVLWTTSEVQVSFGTEFKNMYLLFCYDSDEYKLEISAERIREIELHCPRGQLRKFLLIQVCQPKFSHFASLL